MSARDTAICPVCYAALDLGEDYLDIDDFADLTCSDTMRKTHLGISPAECGARVRVRAVRFFEVERVEDKK